MPETPTTFYHSKRNGPTDYPVYNHKNEIVCVCPTQALASSVANAMKVFNQPEPQPARDVKPSTLKDLDTGEPVLFIKVSDFEAMRQEIKTGKLALSESQWSEKDLLDSRDRLLRRVNELLEDPSEASKLRDRLTVAKTIIEDHETKVQNQRAQLTERAAIIKDLEAQARVMMVQIEEDKMTISALREDAAKDAAELRDLRVLKQKYYMSVSGKDVGGASF